MNVVVVESPAKAKTINKYLGSGYKVLASFGHVRDLPAKDGSVNPDEDFDMTWQVDSASNKRLKEISDAVKASDGLILATDPDREGEAISWHVLEVLRKKRGVLDDKPVKRVVFNAITKQAVLDAIAHPGTGALVEQEDLLVEALAVAAEAGGGALSGGSASRLDLGEGSLDRLVGSAVLNASRGQVDCNVVV